ncbi:MAG: ANTAR domain-containing protein [Oribacterium sp.]|nr:ANTAR domain-containing protein [Oribacterium sp.]
MNIVVAFARSKDIQNFKSILKRGGYDSVSAYTSGVQALSAMDDLGSGVIICGYRLSDMLYSDLLHDLPPYFKMLLIASKGYAPTENMGDNLIYLESPFQVSNLFSTISIMSDGIRSLRKKAKERRKHRSEEEIRTIDKAKALLMERHHMTEPEAHKYLQKCSMDSGTNMLEAAEMIISLTSI